jgi:hypothetical protein
VKSVDQFNDTTGSFYIINLDRQLNPADVSGSSIPGPINKYIALKRLPDETNVILNYDLQQSITQDGLLFPQYIDAKVKENSGNTVKALKSQNLIAP